MTDAYRKKLIEVALPLEAINKAAAREKSIRHGHPSTLHLWWARRPLAACRAVLFASLVDDPGAVPEEFPTDAEQQHERERLFRLIEQLVLWENSTNQTVLNAARREIARSVARAKKLELPVSDHGIQRFLIEHAPPVLDPFCGGGSIPLEAQRLGLRAYGSDLNPVAVLITKALIELPPQFAGQPPVNPQDRAGMARGVNWPGASGLAADVRYYGQWMRDQAHQRIGHLYPKVALPKEHGGGEATVIAWLWARTVKCPNPACGARMPLVRSFALSTKKGKEAWVEPQVDQAAKTVRFAVRTGSGKAPDGTVNRGGARCIVCATSVPFDHVRAEGRAGRMGQQMMAVVAEGQRARVYLDPTDGQEAIAKEAVPEWAPDTELPEKALGFRVQLYGMTRHRDLFTSRQLVALSTFSDLVGEARECVLVDAAGRADAQARADAVATYLSITVSKTAVFHNTLSRWRAGEGKSAQAFGRQAIPMVWDFAEVNPFAGAGGDFAGVVDGTVKVLKSVAAEPDGQVAQRDAAKPMTSSDRITICTDPPYYDNIGYADLSDFFYVWLRRGSRGAYPNLFSTLLVPKTEELVATPYRFSGSKEQARRFFEKGLGDAFARMHAAQTPGYPMTVFYAFKQAEEESNDDEDGEGPSVSSTGWETMLEGLLGAGLTIGGTWPISTENATRMIASGTNSLASSIVLVCRPRPADAPAATRGEFLATLRRELPKALRELQQGSIAPVDLNQAAIGPGMAIFSRYARVVDAQGGAVSVRAALQSINQEVESYLAGQEGELDEESRFCLAWFRQFGFQPGRFGEADVMARAMNTSVQRLHESGVLQAGGGNVRLLSQREQAAAWDPRTDPRLNDWKCLHHLIGALYNDDTALGGETGAGRVLKLIGAERAERARDLAYRLFAICERKGWTDEAQAYNGLAASWPAIQARAAERGPLEQGMLA